LQSEQAAVNVASPDVLGSLIVASLTWPAYVIQTVTPAISDTNSLQVIVVELHNPVLSKITLVIVNPPVQASLALAALYLNAGAAVVVVDAAVVVDVVDVVVVVVGGSVVDVVVVLVSPGGNGIVVVLVVELVVVVVGASVVVEVVLLVDVLVLVVDVVEVDVLVLVVEVVDVVDVVGHGVSPLNSPSTTFQ